MPEGVIESPPPVETTVPPTAPDGTASTAPTSPEAAAGTAPPKTYASVQEALDAADPDEIRTHARVAGIVGDLAQKRAKALQEEVEQRVRQEQAVLQQQSLLERMRRLADEDPYQFTEMMKQDWARREQLAQQQQAQEAIKSTVYTDLNGRVQQLARTLPMEVQTQLAGKTYAGTYEEGFAAYTQDVIDLTRAYEASTAVAREREKLSKDVKEAVRKQVLSELNGGEETAPEADMGTPAGSDTATQAEMDANRHNPKWLKANIQRVKRGLSAGTIKH